MMKIILAMAILLASTVSLQADVDENIKKQCQYMVYGNGKNDGYAAVYMAGMIDGMLFYVETDKRTETALKGTLTQISEIACKEAFADNSLSNFSGKFSMGVSVTVNKEDAKYSLLK